MTSSKSTLKTQISTTELGKANSPWNPNTIFWIHLAIITAFLFVLRIHLMNIPLERDESAYAYLGKRAAEGLAPYRDFYEMKPPFLFYGYAILNTIFGYSEFGLRLMAWFLTWLICIGVYLIGKALMGSKYALIAAITMVILSANPYSSMVLAVSELLLMCLALFGFWLMFQLIDTNVQPTTERWYLLGAGALIGSSIMVKQSAVFFLGFAAIVLLLLAKTGNFKLWLSSLVRKGLWFSAGAITPVALSLLIVLGFGVWEEFKFWNITYPQLYSINANPTSAVESLTMNFLKLWRYQEFLWVLAAMGLLMLVFSNLSPKKKIALLALTIFSLITIFPGKRFYLHYWIQFIPVIPLLLAHLFFSIEYLGGRFSLNMLKNLSFAIAGVALALVIFTTTPLWLRSDPNFILRDMFGGNPYVEDKLIARLIASKIQPDDEVAVLGSEPQLYVYLKRKAPSRHFYVAFLSRNHQYTQSWQKEAFEALKIKNPKYIAFYFVPFSWMIRPDSYQGFYQNSYSWAINNYSPIAWVDYIDYFNPTVVLDAEATNYKPQSGSYIMLLERK